MKTGKLIYLGEKLSKEEKYGKINFSFLGAFREVKKKEPYLSN